MKPCLLALPGNEAMAAAVARTMGFDCECDAIALHRFPDGETSLRTVAKLDGRDVGLVCTLDRPDEKLSALLFAAELCRDLGATSVGLLAPYLAYMRQDIRFNPGESVTAKYFARLLSAHFDWLVTVDPHLHRIATLDAVYTIPASAVQAAPVIGEWIARHVSRPGLVGPDAESRQWVEQVARHADAPFLILEKTRSGDTDVAVTAPAADWLPRCTPVIVDDIASSGRTFVAAILAIVAAGGAKPVCVVVHPLFAGDAMAVMEAEGATRIASCNTVTHASNAISIESQLSVAVAENLRAMAGRRFLILR